MYEVYTVNIVSKEERVLEENIKHISDAANIREKIIRRVSKSKKMSNRVYYRKMTNENSGN